MGHCHCGADTQNNPQGLNSSAGLLAASWGCSQLWQCLVLTDRSAEKRLNHTATSGLLDQQCLARFISPTWGWAVFWGDAVTVHLSEPCSMRQTCRFLNSNTQRCFFCFSANKLRKNLKISERWHTFAFAPTLFPVFPSCGLSLLSLQDLLRAYRAGPESCRLVPGGLLQHRQERSNAPGYVISYSLTQDT